MSLATVGLIAIGGFFVLGVILRLAMGPVSLGPFSDQLRQSVLNALPGLAIRYDDAALEWSRDESRVNLLIVGAQVFDDEGHVVARAPKAEIGLAAGPLLRGNVEVQRITLVGVQLTLVRRKDGTLHLGTEKNQSREDVLERIRQAIAKSGNGPSTLQRFAVSRARLAFYDERSEAFVVAPRADIEIASARGHANGQLIANVDANIEITGSPARIVAAIKLPQDGGPLTGDVSITGLELVALARNSPRFAALKPFDLRTDITGSFVMAHGRRLSSLDLGLDARGIVGGFGSPLTVKDLRFLGRYDAASGRVLIEDATLTGETATAHALGSAELAFGGDGSLARVDLDLTADKIALAMPAAFRHAVTLGGVSLRGAYTVADSTIAIDQLLLSGSALSGEMKGRVALVENRSPGIDLDGKLNALSMHDLVRYWPLRVGEGARDWIAANMPVGRVGPIKLAAHIAPGQLDQPALPEAALNLSFPVSGASVNYLNGMSLLTNVNGSALLTGDTFKAQVASGRIAAVNVRQAGITIPKLHQHGTTGDISVSLQGQVRDLLAVLDEKPLNYPTRFHIKPAETSGTVTATGDFHVPMVKNVGIDRIPIAVKAQVNGLVLSLGPDAQLSGGNLTFDVDNTHLHAIGTLAYRAMPLAAEWTESFDSRADITTRVNLRGTFDDAQRAALKINLSDFLSGPVGVSAQLTGHQGNIHAAQATLDLTSAAISVPPISYAKAAGIAATAQASARLDTTGNVSAATVTASGAGLSVQGTLSFAGDGKLVRADLPVVHAGPANDFALVLTQGAGNALDVSIHGRSADGSAFGRDQTSTAASKPESSTTYHVVARLDRFVLKENTVLTPFTLDANATGSRIQSMSLTTGVSKSDSVTASITPAADGRRLTVNASDAGLLLKGFFGLDDISGGRIAIAAHMPPVNAPKNVPDYSGTLTIRDFKIENQPFFARLFAAGSLGGLLDLMRGSGIVIDHLEMPFSSKNSMITIHDAHASGPSVGLSADGYIDRRANQIDLKGAVAPVYGLNSMLGAVPILGDVLVSKKGEGILGVTYEASGSLDEPKINVNPLSLMAPGILRRIFEGNIPSAPAQTQASPTPKPPVH